MPSDAVFARSPEFVGRRSAPKTFTAVGVIVVAIIVIVAAVGNFEALAQHGLARAEDASRPRYRAFGGFLPVGMIILAGAFAVGAVVALAGRGTQVWTRASTGTALRSRHVGRYDIDAASFNRLHAAIAAGNPSAYLPLPEQSRGGYALVQLCTADADELAFAVMSWGRTTRSPQLAPLVRLSGEQYRAFDAALQNGLRKPFPPRR